MNYIISYYSEAVKETIEALPLTLRVRYTFLTQRMIEVGANLGEPHTEAFGNGLFELRRFLLYPGRPSYRNAAQLCEENPKDSAQRAADC